jgi:hypothetical protein
MGSSRKNSHRSPKPCPSDNEQNHSILSDYGCTKADRFGQKGAAQFSFSRCMANDNDDRSFSVADSYLLFACSSLAGKIAQSFHLNPLVKVKIRSYHINLPAFCQARFICFYFNKLKSCPTQESMV